MLPAALIRLKSVEDKLLKEPGPEDVWKGRELSTLFTFEAIFGQLYGGKVDPSNAAYLRKLNTIKG